MSTIKPVNFDENTPLNYIDLKLSIGKMLESSREKVSKRINNILVQTYWHIGQYIVEFEQRGEDQAKYGSKLIANLSKDLTVELGKGFSQSNLKNFILLFKKVRHCLTF